MDKKQIDKLRSMNLGVIADQAEAIISRNARLTADNRRHMQRIEALERENGQLILQIKNGGAVPPEWRVGEFDTVRRTAESDKYFTKGKEYPIVRADADGACVIDDNNETHWLYTEYRCRKWASEHFEVVCSPDPKSGDILGK